MVRIISVLLYTLELGGMGDCSLEDGYMDGWMGTEIKEGTSLGPNSSLPGQKVIHTCFLLVIR